MRRYEQRPETDMYLGIFVKNALPAPHPNAARRTKTRSFL
jgi:hypothetical protein